MKISSFTFTGVDRQEAKYTPLAETVANVIGADNVSISRIPGAIDTTYTYLLLDAETTQTTSKC